MSANPIDAAREAWLKARRSTIGSSDAYRITLGTYGGPWAVLCEKNGLDGAREVTERMDIGTAIEPFIAGLAAKRYGWTLEKGEYITRPETPWMSASLDYVRTDGLDGHEVVEIKNVDARALGEWGTDDAEAEDGTVPDHIRVQVQHQLMVSGFRLAWVVALFGGNTLRRYKVERDPDLMDAVFEKCRDFYRRWQAGEPPPMDGSAGATAALRSMYPQATREEPIDLPGAVDELANHALFYRAEIKRLEWAQVACDNELKLALGENATGRTARYGVGWTNVKGRTSFDARAFEKDHPQLAQSYLRVGAGYRTFKIKELKEGK